MGRTISPMLADAGEMPMTEPEQSEQTPASLSATCVGACGGTAALTTNTQLEGVATMVARSED